MTKKKKWLLGTSGGIVGLLCWVVLLSPWVWPGPGNESLIISKETTYLADPPMKANGQVDYVKYCRDRYSQGVTPENNALACFVRASFVRPAAASACCFVRASWMRLVSSFPAVAWPASAASSEAWLASWVASLAASAWASATCFLRSIRSNTPRLSEESFIAQRKNY